MHSLTIFAGNPSVARRAYLDFQDDIVSRGALVVKNIDIDHLSELTSLETDLWGAQSIYFLEGNFTKKAEKTRIQSFIAIGMEIVIYDPESLQKEIKFTYPEAKINFFAGVSIFTLLDELRPKNLLNVNTIFEELKPTEEVLPLFLQIYGRIRDLYKVQCGIKFQKMQGWQLSKLTSQAKFWQKGKLESFLEGMCRVEVRQKTSTNSLSLDKEIQLLFAFFLK